VTFKTLRAFSSQASEAVAPPASGFVTLPDSGRVEVRFDSLSSSGAPDNVILHFWRRLDGKDDRLKAHSLGTSLSFVTPLVLEAAGGDLAVTVELVGGVAPAFSGTLEVRSIA
jgi:hypothetical protein